MTFQRASIIRGTPGINYDYEYFCWYLTNSMELWRYYRADRDRRDLIATYNMGQEL